MVASTQSEAGPSNSTRKRKQHKPAQKRSIKTGKLKRVTEKQKLEALECDAMNFVSGMRTLFLIELTPSLPGAPGRPETLLGSAYIRADKTRCV